MPGFRTAVTADRDLEILVRGSVTAQDVAYFRHVVAGLLPAATGTDHVRVKMAEYRDSDGESLAVVQVNLELHGRLVRTQAAADALPAAVDRAAIALVPRIDRLRRRLLLGAMGPPSFADEPWDRRGARAMPRTIKTEGRSRQVKRHKAYPLAVQDLGAAAFTMDLRDYDFHLFVDDVSSQNAVLLRAGEAGYRLLVERPELLGRCAGDVPLQGPASSLRRLTLPEAVRALNTSHAAFLAFTGVGSGRGTVLYRRFDGNLGLVTSLW